MHYAVDGRQSRCGDLPAAVTVSLATVVSLASIAGWLGWAVLKGRWSALALVTVAVGTGLFVVLRLRVRAEGDSGLTSLLLTLPAIGVLAPAAAGLLRGAPDGLEWFLNGDHPRHAVYVADTWNQGVLSYATESYPRGWHSALAAMWSLVGAGLDGAHASRLLVMMAAASMALSALLALATAALGHALALRAGLQGSMATVAGFVAGACTLFNFALASFQALGYENSLVAAVALAVASREVLMRPGSVISIIVCSSATILVAHTWQLLLPPVALAALWCARTGIRDGGSRCRQVLVVLAPLTLALSAPALVAVVSRVGIGHAAEAGPNSRVPLLLLVGGVLATALLALRNRDGSTGSYAIIVLTPGVIAMALSVAFAIDPWHYYPSKLLWQSTVLGLPAIGVTTGLVMTRARGRWAEAGPARRALVGLPFGLITIFAFALPWGGQIGTWSTVNGARVLAAVSAPYAESATVVWLQATPTSDSVARILLDIFRVDRTRDRAPQARLTVEAECELLRRAALPVVLSTAEDRAVRGRYGCSREISVLHVGATS